MELEAWEQTISESRRADPLWRRSDYRLATYVADTAWPDVERLSSSPATTEVAAQLYRALGSITANLAEGYSRGSSADRVRYYEYALGSAREAREWYGRAQPVLGHARVADRYAVLTSIVRLLLTIIPSERGRKNGPSFMGRTETHPRGVAERDPVEGRAPKEG